MRQTLTYVNISNNRIITLPTGLGMLPNLQQLNLSNNRLGLSKKMVWPWLQQTAIKNTLLSLDISYNLLTRLPIHIWRLYALKQLRVHNNSLEYISHAVKNAKNLEFLDVSNNRLKWLPQSITFILLIHTLFNPFLRDMRFDILVYKMTKVLKKVESLIDLSAMSILRHRIPYDGLIPNSLVDYLDHIELCIDCGKACTKMFKNYSFTKFLDYAYRPNLCIKDTNFYGGRYFLSYVQCLQCTMNVRYVH